MTEEQRLKNLVYATSRQICEEIGADLDVNFDSDAQDLISELCWKKLAVYATDLEAFQKHAGKRTTITADDVKLLVRRNSSLKEMVENKLQSLKADRSTEAESSTKRKR